MMHKNAFLDATPNPQTTAILEPWRFSIAPMMDWSDRHCRFFWRLLTKHARMYSEMVTTGALLHGDAARFLQFNVEEHPLALQLGGSDPKALAECAKMAEDWGYDEVNLNCGCPSDRVQEGKIGAILMREPALVAECVAAMQQACSIPVSVKHRIGVDDMEDYAGLKHFVCCVAETGCQHMIVHARKAWLKGLSPKANREVPPLMYHHVYQLKQELPQLTLILNGGITQMQQAQLQLNKVDGVMVGREAYQNPYWLAEVDQQFFGSPHPVPTREEVLLKFAAYCEAQISQGTRLQHMSRHILGLFAGCYGARRFRRYITEHANKANATAQVLIDAMALTSA